VASGSVSPGHVSCCENVSWTDRALPAGSARANADSARPMRIQKYGLPPAHPERLTSIRSRASASVLMPWACTQLCWPSVSAR
jgi:hypothetical protein